MLSDGLAGKDIYSDNYNVLVDGKNFTMNDILSIKTNGLKIIFYNIKLYLKFILYFYPQIF